MQREQLLLWAEKYLLSALHDRTWVKRIS